MNYPLLALILGIIWTIVFSTISFLIKSKITDMETDIKNLQTENKEIVENYISRFEQINKNVSNSKLEIMDRFHSLEVKIIEIINKRK